jgi:hypothetical protein
VASKNMLEFIDRSCGSNLEYKSGVSVGEEFWEDLESGSKEQTTQTFVFASFLNEQISHDQFLVLLIVEEFPGFLSSLHRLHLFSELLFKNVQRLHTYV